MVSITTRPATSPPNHAISTTPSSSLPVPASNNLSPTVTPRAHDRHHRRRSPSLSNPPSPTNPTPAPHRITATKLRRALRVGKDSDWSSNKRLQLHPISSKRNNDARSASSIPADPDAEPDTDAEPDADSDADADPDTDAEPDADAKPDTAPSPPSPTPTPTPHRESSTISGILPTFYGIVSTDKIIDSTKLRRSSTKLRPRHRESSIRSRVYSKLRFEARLSIKTWLLIQRLIPGGRHEAWLMLRVSGRSIKI